MRVDYRNVNFDSIYPEEDIVELKIDELKEALENLPCCTTDKEGKKFGDPLNLVIVGDFYNVASAFVRRGWVPAEETYSSAVWKTIKSYFFGSRYRYSPVSSLYFYTFVLRYEEVPLHTCTCGHHGHRDCHRFLLRPALL